MRLAGPRTLLAGRGRLRRLAALSCLLLAAVSALGDPAGDASPRRTPPLSARLLAGEVAVPVPLSGHTDFVHPGDRVDLLAGPEDTFGGPSGGTDSATSVGSALRVLQVMQADPTAFGTDAGTRLLVAADRITAARIAAASGRLIVAVVDKYP